MSMGKKEAMQIKRFRNLQLPYDFIHMGNLMNKLN